MKGQRMAGQRAFHLVEMLVQSMASQWDLQMVMTMVAQ